MTLGSVLSIASSGLAAIQGQIAIVSQNVANANTAGYTEEVAPAMDVVAGDQSAGVRLGIATRVTSPVLQTGLYAQNATVGALTATITALTAITSVEGSTSSTSGSTGSLTALLSGLQASLTSLQADPTSSAQQLSVGQSATAFAAGVNNLAATYAAQRQATNDAIASNVVTINQNLATVGSLSDQIVSLRAAGLSTAAVEDERQSAMTTLSGELSVKFSEQPSGAMVVTTTSGITLPTDAKSGPLAYASASLSPTDTYDPAGGGAIAGISLDGQDVTKALTGGSLGASITLRDTTIPAYTAQLDSFAATTAQRLAAAGLPLLTDGAGAVPPLNPPTAPAVGFSSDVQVATNAAGLLSALTPATIQTIDESAFGDESPAGTAWGAVTASTALPYSSTGTLSDFASNLIASQGADAQATQSSLADATAMQTALTAEVSNVSGVSIDTEMSKLVALQNSYQANAKVVSAVQTMYTAILDAINP